MGTPLKIKKAMSRDEVALLVDLVVSRPIITSKETNAATNKLKEDAWNSLAIDFNSISGQSRSKDQIKLKWDNLKKAARKRVQTDRDTPDLVPLGDILEKVSGLLGVSRTDVPYDGDWIVVDSVGESFSNAAKKRKVEEPPEESFISKYKKKFQTHTGKKEGNGVKERNLAIARYYEKKTQKLNLEIQLMKLQLNKQCKCANNTVFNKTNHIVNNSENYSGMSGKSVDNVTNNIHAGKFDVSVKINRHDETDSDVKINSGGKNDCSDDSSDSGDHRSVKGGGKKENRSP